jgi:23S rRNA pseudouridine2605 synthase
MNDDANDADDPKPAPPAPKATADVSGDASAADTTGVAGETTEDGGPGRPRRKRRRGRKGRAAKEGGSAAERPSDGPAREAAAAPALPTPDTRELFEQVTAGAFDSDAEALPAAESEPATSEAPADAAGVEAGPERRILAPDADAPKLQKVLAQSGLGSRRDLEQWITEGRITVNDEPAHVGQRVSWGDRVAIDGKPVKVRIAPLPTRVLASAKW